MASDVRILRKNEVLKLTGLGKSWIDVLERRGEFPQRRKLSGRACGWLSTEIDEWIRNRPQINTEGSPPNAAAPPATSAAAPTRKPKAAARGR